MTDRAEHADLESAMLHALHKCMARIVSMHDEIRALQKLAEHQGERIVKLEANQKADAELWHEHEERLVELDQRGESPAYLRIASGADIHASMFQDGGHVLRVSKP
jgi:hypothetical protein